MTIISLIRSLGMASVLAIPALAQEVQLTGAKPGKPAAVKVTAKSGVSGPQSASGGNSWFPVTVRELGTYYGQGEAIGLFPFENPHDAEIEWRGLTPSCQCARAEIRVGKRLYRVIAKPQKRIVRVVKRPGQPDKLENVQSITIGPKEKGSIETRLNMHSITGPKSATLDIHSTDPVEAHFKLTFRARGAQLFSISPKEINLNKMSWNETREFSVTVASSSKRDWEIKSMDNSSEAFDVTWEKISFGDRTSYKILGKYSPKGETTQGGGVLKFRTDVNGAATFNVRVLAFVQGPLEIKPGSFLTLGLIRKGKTVTKSVVFEPNDGIDLQATALDFEKMTLASDYIRAASHKEGNKLVVELSVADNAPTGLVKGELVVKLNHPLIKEKRILFNGFVR